jgi:hypothetical protein
MDDVIAAFELRFGDGTHLCEMKEGPGKQPCGYTPGQVAAVFLDARNLPCNFLPPNQEPAGWNVLRNMLIALINEDRVAAAVVAPGTGGPAEETLWLATASAMYNFEGCDSDTLAIGRATEALPISGTNVKSYKYTHRRPVPMCTNTLERRGEARSDWYCKMG